MAKNPSGSYLLIMLNKKDHSLKIGALGSIFMKEGIYIYVGSAMNGHLINRVKRHAKPADEKKLHWHIDYFLSSEYVSLQRIMLIPSSIKEECQLSQWINKNSCEKISGFGCSDCSCNSHLYYFKETADFCILL